MINSLSIGLSRCQQRTALQIMSSLLDIPPKLPSHSSLLSIDGSSAYVDSNSMFVKCRYTFSGLEKYASSPPTFGVR